MEGLAFLILKKKCLLCRNLCKICINKSNDLVMQFDTSRDGSGLIYIRPDPDPTSQDTPDPDPDRTSEEKLFLLSDPDPEIFENRIQIRIKRNSKTGSESGPRDF